MSSEVIHTAASHENDIARDSELESHAEAIARAKSLFTFAGMQSFKWQGSPSKRTTDSVYVKGSELLGAIGEDSFKIPCCSRGKVCAVIVLVWVFESALFSLPHGQQHQVLLDVEVQYYRKSRIQLEVAAGRFVTWKQTFPDG
uniref:Zinc transporter ZIP3 n=1 Tax=Parascaris univalens TaxID=6257 RepID=A0A915B0Y9_PARUN